MNANQLYRVSHLRSGITQTRTENRLAGSTTRSILKKDTTGHRDTTGGHYTGKSLTKRSGAAYTVFLNL